MRIAFTKSAMAWRGKMIYLRAQHSLSFEPLGNVRDSWGKKGFASLSFQTLQLELDIASGAFLYPWGYFPLVNASDREIPEYDWEDGLLTIEGRTLTPGVSLDYAAAQHWVKLIDKKRPTLYFGQREFSLGEKRIRFCDGAVACISGDSIIALVLQPLWN